MEATDHDLPMPFTFIYNSASRHTEVTQNSETLHRGWQDIARSSWLMLFCSCSVAKVPLIMVATRRSPWLKHVGAGESRDFWLFCSGFPGCISVAMGRMPQNQRDCGAETDGSNSKNPGKIGKGCDIYTYLLDVTGLKMIAGLFVLGYPLVI